MSAIVLSTVFFGIAIATIPLIYILVVCVMSSSIRPHNIPKGPEKKLSPDKELQAQINYIKIDSMIRPHF